MLSNFFFTCILLSSLIFITHSYNTHLCLEDHKSLLLQLKNELIFNSSISTKLVQWNQTDECCKWYGVECDDAGNVISLQLDDESISGGIGDSSSLFGLKYLEKLNLAYNDFESPPIPKGIHNLNYLTHLNLSNAGFGGQVPAEITSLRRLVSLDISIVDWMSYSLKLEYPNLKMLVRNLTGLRELYLDRANITSSRERGKWSHIISSYLPDLTTLSFVHCYLSGPLAKSFSQLHSLSFLRLDENDLSAVAPHSFANLSSLTTLSLAGCGLKGSFPNKIFHIPTLQYLDLSGNKLLSGSIPPFTQNGSLKSIVLRETNFSGLIPSSISNLKTLSEIVLSGCKFTGSIPSTFANLTQLTYVGLESNSFSGKIPHSLFGLPSLKKLYLSNNHFTGQVEEFSIGINVSNIDVLDLSRNQLEGPIPHSLFGLPSLKTLYLSNNHFTGQVEEFSIGINVSNIVVLDLSRNQLEGPIPHSLFGLPSLKTLDLSNNHFTGQVEELSIVINVSNIGYLDLSSNRLEGPIPDFFFQLQSLDSLDLSNNLFSGSFQLENIRRLPNLTYLNLRSNHLSGELHLIIANITSHLGSIPTSLCTATQLRNLDLSENKLSGSIPSCLLAMSRLDMLELGRNNISGRIPDNFSPNCNLVHLHLNDNTLEGKIPKSLQNCKWLQFVNVGKNIINDTFPCMLPSTLCALSLHSNSFHGEVTCHNSSWPDLQILDISSNHFSGSLESINFSSWRAMVQQSDSELRYNDLLSDFDNSFRFRFTMKGLEVDLVEIFQDFTAIDLSCNNFIGEIPNVIGDLSLLHYLNLSYNSLNGSIPKSFGKLGNLESLDLSQNQLTGAIPTELARLSFLSFLNLSYNMLVGEIPNGRQLQTFSGDSFKGNPWLCGFNLNISCTPTDSLEHENEEEIKKREIEWEYVSAALGYVVGLGSIVWLLLFCRSIRKIYFDKIDDVVQQIFDARDVRKRRRATARRRAVMRNRVGRQ